jgi:hypothetical protein
VGKWAEDFIAGKLGEIGLGRFLEERFNVRVAPDFTLREHVIIGQDIGEVSRRRRGRWVANPPRLRVNIKATKMKNVYMFVARQEFEDEQRQSDVYILTRVGLPDDQLIRFLRDHPGLARVRGRIPTFEPFPVQIAGFAWRRDLGEHYYPEGIADADVRSPQYVMPTGALRRSPADWRELARQL